MISIKAASTALVVVSKFPTLPTNLHSQFHKPIKISCTKDNREALSDETLATELNLEFRKLNSQAADREEALKKSRQILFTEVCNFAGLRSEEMRKKWQRMSDEDRWGLAKGFVVGWSAHWHPLSARFVKEMVDEHLGQNAGICDAVVSGKIFPGLRKLLRFSGNDEE